MPFIGNKDKKTSTDQGAQNTPQKKSNPQSMSADTYKKYEQSFNQYKKTGNYGDTSWMKQNEVDLFNNIRQGKGKSALANGTYYYMDNDTYDKYGRSHSNWMSTGNYGDTSWMTQNGVDAYNAIRGSRSKQDNAFDDFRYSLNDDILDSVRQKYRDKYFGDKNYYDYTGGEIYAQGAGEMPEYLKGKYDQNDPYDRWLYENGLPYSSVFNDLYSEAVNDYNENLQREAEKKAAEDEKQRAAAEEEQKYLTAENEFRNAVYKRINELGEGASDEEWRAAIAEVYESDPEKYQDVIENFNYKAGTEDELVPGTNKYFDNLSKKKKNEKLFTVADLMTEYNGLIEKSQAEYIASLPPEQQEEVTSYLEDQKAQEQQLSLTQQLRQIDAEITRLGASGWNPNSKKIRELSEQRRGIVEQLDAVNAERNEKTRADLNERLLEADTDVAQEDIEKELVELGKKLAGYKQTDGSYRVTTENKEAVERLNELNKYFTLTETAGRSLQAVNGFIAENGGTDEIADTSKWSAKARQQYKVLSGQVKTGSKLAKLATPEEIAGANAAAAMGEEAFQKYFNELETVLKFRSTVERKEDFQRLAQQDAVGGSILSVGANVLGAVEGVGNILGNAGNITRNLGVGQGNAVDMVYNGYMTAASKEIRNAVSDDIILNNSDQSFLPGISTGQIYSFLYQSGMSMLDSSVRLPLGGAGLAIAGLSAADSTILDQLENGATAREAMALGVIAGMAEIVTEKVSLEQLLKPKAAGTLKQFLRETLKQSGVEASEEIFSEVINILAEAITLEDNDLSWKGIMNRIIESGLGGAISGLGFGAAGMGARFAREGRNRTDIQNARNLTTDLLGENGGTSFFGKTGEMSKFRFEFIKAVERSGWSEETQTDLNNLMDQMADDYGFIGSDDGQRIVRDLKRMVENESGRHQAEIANFQQEQEKNQIRLTKMLDNLTNLSEQAASMVGDPEGHSILYNQFMDATKEYQDAQREVENKEKVAELKLAESERNTEQKVLDEIEKTAQEYQAVSATIAETAAGAQLAGLEQQLLNQEVNASETDYIKNMSADEIEDAKVTAMQNGDERTFNLLDEMLDAKKSGDDKQIADFAAKNPDIVDMMWNSELDDTLKKAPAPESVMEQTVNASKTGYTDAINNIDAIRSAILNGKQEQRNNGRNAETAETENGTVRNNGQIRNQNAAEQTDVGRNSQISEDAEKVKSRVFAPWTENENKGAQKIESLYKQQGINLRVNQVQGVSPVYAESVGAAVHFLGAKDGVTLYTQTKDSDGYGINGICYNGKPMVRYTGNDSDIAYLYHEYGHANPHYIQLVKDALGDQFGRILDKYINTAPDSQNGYTRDEMSEELLCDLFGLYGMHQVFGAEAGENDYISERQMQKLFDAMDSAWSDTAFAEDNETVRQLAPDEKYSLSDRNVFTKAQDESDREALSTRTVDAWANKMRKENGKNAKTDKIISQVDSIRDYILNDKSIAQYAARGDIPGNKMGPLVKNIEYKYSFDVDANCERRMQYSNYLDQIQSRLGRLLTLKECRQLVELMRACDQMIPCTYCYVEGKRMQMSNYTLNFLNTRQNVLNAATDDDALPLMYSYNKDKGTISAAAQEVFNKWRSLGKDAYNPTVSQHFYNVQHFRNQMFDFLDSRYGLEKYYKSVEGGRFQSYKPGIGKKKMLSALCKEFGIDESGPAFKQAEAFFNAWFEDMVQQVPHVKQSEFPQGFIPTADMNDVLSLEREASAYAKSASQARNIDSYRPYTTNLREVSAEDKKNINARGGLRVHSSNDFQIQNVLDYMQLIGDMDALGGWYGHTYTKNGDFVRIFGNTGYKFNMSIAMTGDFTTGIRENHQEGMFWREVQDLRKQFKHAGAMAMVVNDDQLSFALNADWIDMIIPFHASGMEKEYWYNVLMWNDYTRSQNERFLDSGAKRTGLEQFLSDADKVNTINEQFDEAKKAAYLKKQGVSDVSELSPAQINEMFGKALSNMSADQLDDFYRSELGIKDIWVTKNVTNDDGTKETVRTRKVPHFLPYEQVIDGQVIPGHNNDQETYLRLCREYGVKPRFDGVMVDDGNGNMINIVDHPNYFKVIKETSRTDSPQEFVKANYTDEQMQHIKDSLKGFADIHGYDNMSEDPWGIVPTFLQEYAGKNRDYLDEDGNFWLPNKIKQISEIIHGSTPVENQTSVIHKRLVDNGYDDLVSGMYAEPVAKASNREIRLDDPADAEFFADAAQKGFTVPALHGSPTSGITAFDMQYAGRNTESFGDRAIWFTDDAEYADHMSYEQIPSRMSNFFTIRGNKGTVYKAALKMERPFDFNNLSESDRDFLYETTARDRYGMTREEFDEDLNNLLQIGNHQLLKTYLDYNALRDAGYDSVIARLYPYSGAGSRGITENPDGLEYGVLNGDQVMVNPRTDTASDDVYDLSSRNIDFKGPDGKSVQYAVNIRPDNVSKTDYARLMFDVGEDGNYLKTVETRTNNRLDPLTDGNWQAVSDKGRIPGFVKIGTAFEYADPDEFRADYNRHRIEPGSEFDWTWDDYNRGVRKFGYPITDVSVLDEDIETPRGAVERFSYKRFLDDAPLSTRVNNYIENRSDAETSLSSRTIPTNSKRSEEVAKQAEALFKTGTSLTDYYNSGNYDNAVAAQLRTLMLKNGQDVGGKLSEQEVSKIIKDAANWKKGNMYAFKAPVRIFQDVGKWHDTKSKNAADYSRAVALNMEADEYYSDKYYSYMQQQLADENVFKQGVLDKINEIDPSESDAVLAQLIGEKVITPDMAQNAVMDKKHILIPIGNGAMVLDRKGRVRYMADQQSLLLFSDDVLKKAAERARKINEIRNDSKPNKDERIKAVQKSGTGPEETMGVYHLEKNGDHYSIVNENGNAVFEMDGENAYSDKAVQLADTLSAIYGSMYDSVQSTLVENGYAPIGHIENYFPHFTQAREGVAGMIDYLKSEDLPVGIAGLTPDFSPGKPWARNLLTRLGDKTDYNAVRGFEGYLNGVSDVIYMTPVIQRFRQLESALRTGMASKTSEEGPVNEANTNFIRWLHDYTNQLANKKPMVDRGVEETFGRKVYTLPTKLSGLIGTAYIGANVRTALTNMASFAQGAGQLAPKWIGRGLFNTATSDQSEFGDDFRNVCTFLINRQSQAEEVALNMGDKFRQRGEKILFGLMEAVDNFSTETIARAKYYQLTQEEGLSSEDALREVSKWCVKLFAERSKGSRATIFNSKVMSPLTQFQIEPFNQLWHWSDIHNENIRSEYRRILRENGGTLDGVDWSNVENQVNKVSVSAKDLKKILGRLIALSVYGMIMRVLTGADATWNPAGIISDMVNGARKNGAEGAGKAVRKNIMDNIPFSSLVEMIGSAIGLGDDEFGSTTSIPIPALSAVNTAISAIKGGTPESYLEGATYFIPGGGQLRKTAKGVGALVREGSYNKNGKLRYPIDQTPGNAIRAAVFGTSAVAPNGYEYGNVLSEKQTGAYQTAVDQGVDKHDAYDFLMNQYQADSKAYELASLATSDLDDADMRIMAEILGIDVGKGDIKKQAVKEVREQIKSVEKKHKKGTIKDDTYEKRIADYEAFLEDLLRG